MGIAEQAPMLKTTLAELPETRLELSLRGLFVSKGSELSGAVIETGDKQPSFFQVGDLISDDITLAAIEGQAAVIERNGKREKLSFDQAVITIDSYSRSKNPDFIPTTQRGEIRQIDHSNGSGRRVSTKPVTRGSPAHTAPTIPAKKLKGFKSR